MKPALAILLLLAMTFAGCTAPEPGDSDGDGLTDKEERAGWTIIVDLMGKRISLEVNSDPGLEDTDGDGVLDRFELALGLNPRSADTDEDGLSDCQEHRHTNRTECEDPTFADEDGGYGTTGHRADSDPRPSRYWTTVGFEDETGTLQPGEVLGDGISDGDEIMGYTVHLPGNKTRFITSDPLVIDSDDDLLQDGEEAYLYGSDPLTRDTDGDGCDDGLDPEPRFREALRVQIDHITWTTPGRSGSTDVQLIMNIADQPVNRGESGDIVLRHGQENDLTSVDLGDVRPERCTYQPVHAWQRVSLQVWEPDAGAILDMTSQTAPNDAGMIWFNLQDGSYSWDARTRNALAQNPAFDLEGPVMMEGPDGTVAMHIEVVST